MLDLLTTPARQSAALEETAHRPWPLPEGGWVLAQTWDDVLFAHWPVPADELRPLVPEPLELQTRDGSAWLGVTPFAVTGLRLRGTLPVPYLSDFLELNVRTYVELDGRPGVWFLSLDASSPLAVETARRAYRLPYFRARMSLERRGGRVDFRSARRESARPYVWESVHGPAGEAAPAAPGSLEHFLAERYCLYAPGADGVLRAEIHHAPWLLQPAEAEIALNTMAPPEVELPDAAPLLHLAARQDVLVWAPEPA